MEKTHKILASYYQRFVEKFSDIVKSCTELTRQNTSFTWTPLCQLSLDTIKEALTNSPILIFTNPNQPHGLFIDILNTVGLEYSLRNV